jgi:hypothetical protein
MKSNYPPRPSISTDRNPTHQNLCVLCTHFITQNVSILGIFVNFYSRSLSLSSESVVINYTSCNQAESNVGFKRVNTRHSQMVIFEDRLSVYHVS